MATLRIKRKLAAINRVNHEDHPRNDQALNTISCRIQEGYITQVSEDIQDRVTTKLSQEFTRIENRILGALSRLDEFLPNPQARVHSGPVPETSRNSNIENQGTNEDRSQNDPNHEVGIYLSQSSQELGPEETSYKCGTEYWPH